MIDPATTPPLGWGDILIRVFVAEMAAALLVCTALIYLEPAEPKAGEPRRRWITVLDGRQRGDPHLLALVAGSGHPVTWRTGALALLGAVFACVVAECVLRRVNRRATRCNNLKHPHSPSSR